MRAVCLIKTRRLFYRCFIKSMSDVFSHYHPYVYQKIFRSETKISERKKATSRERVVLSSALLFSDNSEDERFCFDNSLKFHLMYFEVLSPFQAELIGFKRNFNFQLCYGEFLRDWKLFLKF